MCRFPCQNGGVCERPNACSCPDGWMGRLCEERMYFIPKCNFKDVVGKTSEFTAVNRGGKLKA